MKEQVSIQTLRQMIGVSLAALWVLCLFYRPIQVLDYTYLIAFKDALFNLEAGFAWYVRLVLASPMLLLALATGLYILRCQEKPGIKDWMVTAAMLAAFSLHSTYSGFMMWGSDVVSIFLKLHLPDLRHDTLARAWQWIVYEDYWETYWFNLVTPFLLQLCLSSYRQILKQEQAYRPTPQILQRMPPLPLHGFPVTMPVLP